MNLISVKSSMINAVGYDTDTRTLEVVFNSGKVFQYYDVPPDIYEGLMSAESKGHYMRNYIIDFYECKQLKRKKR